MKILLLSLLLPLSALASVPMHDGLPHILPDAPSSAYPREAINRLMGFDALDAVTRAGQRNLEWLNRINEKRPAGQKLSLTSKETTRAYPIDQPNEYNPTIILRDFNALKDKYPEALAKVVFGTAALPDTAPMNDADYVSWSEKLDRAYQSAARWRTMAPYLSMLERRRAQDIRGYYFFSRLKDRAAKLKSPKSWSSEEKAQYREWLIGMCLNGSWSSLSSCTRNVDNTINGNQDAEALYKSFEAKSASIYNGYFQIPSYAPRSEFRWEKLGSNKEQFITPFTDPEDEAVRRFLQENIEDEWRFGNWALRFPFTKASGHPYVVFQPDVTPHVNGLGGAEITMNSNQPLSEYDAQWTIRHEFGHVLGLPDCYVEFYVPERQAIINYQIDIDNIMCSRRGHVKQTNVDELRRAYAK
jgi:hypothetical protein